MKTLTQNLKIKSVSKSTIARATDVFSYIDSDFKNYGTDVKSPKTKATEMTVLEQEKDGTFKDIFTSISSDLDSLCLTQAQIIEFCKTHKSELRLEYYGNFFLFKVGSEFFVANVRVGDGELRVYVSRLSRDSVWYAESRHRVVVPETSISEHQTLNPLYLRFFEKVEKGDKCWIWKGAVDAHGYGSFVIEGLTKKSHRVSYEMSKGEIPEGLVIDHICKNKLCVNPEHLRAISRVENVMIGDGPTAKNARKTHCNRNHPLSGSNLYTYKGKRYCKACRSSPQLALGKVGASESLTPIPSETLPNELVINGVTYIKK